MSSISDIFLLVNALRKFKMEVFHVEMDNLRNSYHCFQKKSSGSCEKNMKRRDIKICFEAPFYYVNRIKWFKYPKIKLYLF